MRACWALSILRRRSRSTGGSPRLSTCLRVVDPVDDTYRRQMNWQFPVQESRYKPTRDVYHGKRGAIHQAYRDGMEGRPGRSRFTVGGPAADALRPLRNPDAVELDLDDDDGHAACFTAVPSIQPGGGGRVTAVSCFLRCATEPVAVGRSAVPALDPCGGAVQLGKDCADGLPGGALGPVEDVDVASGVYSAERLEDDVGVRPSGPTGHQREAAAGGDGLGDHREFIDAVDVVEPTVRHARDGRDDGHQREAVVHRDPGPVRHVPRREQRLGRQHMAGRQGDIEGLAQQRDGGHCAWPLRAMIQAVGEHEIIATGKGRNAVLGDVLVRERQAGLPGRQGCARNLASTGVRPAGPW